MERPMRRARQALELAEALEILRRHTHGVMALVDEDGEPYAVPLSYVVLDGEEGLRLLFHCARSGHKLHCIEHEPRVSFCVVGEDRIVPERFTTCYRSVIAFGRARVILPGEAGTAETCEVEEALAELAGKYSPGIDSAEEIASALSRVAIIEMAVDRLSGKQAKELMARSR